MEPKSLKIEDQLDPPPTHHWFSYNKKKYQTREA